MAKKKKSRFSGKVAEDATKRKNQGAAYGYLNLPKGITVFKEDAKKRVVMDIIPYKISDPKHPDLDTSLEKALKGDAWYKRPFKIHRQIGADNATVLCLTSFGERCPICEEREKMKREGADKDDYVPLYPSNRNLYLIIPIDYKDSDEELHVWDISTYCFQDKLDEELEEDPSLEVFPDSEQGSSLKIRFSEENIGKTKFAKTSRIDFEDRKKQYKEDHFEKVPCLDEFFNKPTYKELQALFLELDPEDMVEEKPAKKGKKDKKDKKGKKDKNPSKEEKAEKEEKPAKEGKRKRKTNKKECPHGYVFGKDTDDRKKCDRCELWEECIAEKERK